jgi:penicillin-binding protein 1A
MTSMMQDVVRYGTAARAGQLGRSDLAGKTGTTNDARDTWFAGYNPDLVAISWMGYDQPRSLGRGETGAQSALPIWINFMGPALRGVPQTGWAMPAGIVAMKIDPATGTRFSETIVDELLGDLLGNQTPGIVEHFYQEFPPPKATAADVDAEPATPTGPAPAAPAEPEPTSPWVPL